MAQFFSISLMLTSIITILLYNFWYSIVTYHPGSTPQPVEEKAVEERAPFFIREHGEYWILYNYIAGWETRLVGNASITLTTHAEYTDLEEIVRLARSWNGAISVAVYATGSDFSQLIDSIHYLYDCTDDGMYVQLSVNFHVVVHEAHMPSSVPKRSGLFKYPSDCTKRHKKAMNYREMHNLRYPTNMLRNAAREAARTDHVFPLDLKVYPSVAFIVDFQHMQRMMPKPPPNTIYCFPLFRMVSYRAFPLTKKQLLGFVDQNLAVPVAQATEVLPQLTSWLNSSPYNPMKILTTLHGKVKWDPYFVGVKDELPVYDERVNERNVNFALMQRLGYHIHIMDGAFLMQNPDNKIIQNESEEINLQYLNELLILYGDLKKGTNRTKKVE